MKAPDLADRNPSPFDLSDVPTDLLVGGAWIGASSGARFGVFNPATEEQIASVADATAEDGLRAVEEAARSAPRWAATPPRQRGEILRNAFELMTLRLEWFAGLISLENGKAISDSRAEVAYAAEFFRWYSEEAVRASGSLGLAPSGANRLLVQHRPVGICLLVTPWNFPAAMATRKIGPALAAGCPCILKPAAETPLTALAMAKLLSEAGLPDGVLQVLPTQNPGPLVSTILHEPRVRKLSFTGSTAVGRRLLKEAADQVINCSMELGGNAPFLVFDDADLDAAIEGAMAAKMRNGGEACTAANRFYVQRGVAETFCLRLSERMGRLESGPGSLESTKLGPLVNAKTRDKVAELVDDALSRGAQAVVGGVRPGGMGFFYPATVLRDVRRGSRLLNEEIFGPVAPIVVFDTEEEAVQLANQTEYGLVAYVYTADLSRGLRVSEGIETGMVGLNRGMISDPAAPFGGMKQSGIGREGGHHGILDYLEPQYIATNW
jgi:succinate-semialdehyde dehydrogenase/glutarate-semialdehyde dehydrogenase